MLEKTYWFTLWLQLYSSAIVFNKNPKLLNNMHKFRSRWHVVALICTLVPTGPALASGDPEAGKIKADTCTGCHGIPGYKNVYPTFHVPKIGGQNEAYLVSALKAYREGERQHDTMQLQGQALSDQDIADIAAYFASLGGED